MAPGCSLGLSLLFCGGLLAVGRGLLAVASCRLAIAARLVPVLPRVCAVSVAGEALEGGVDACVTGPLALLARPPALVEERGAVRGGRVTVACAPRPVDARLRTVRLGTWSVIDTGVGGAVTGLTRPVTPLGGTISAIGLGDQRADPSLPLIGRSFALVGAPVTLIRVAVALIGEPVPLVGGSVPLVGGSVPLVVRCAAHLNLAPSWLTTRLMTGL